MQRRQLLENDMHTLKKSSENQSSMQRAQSPLPEDFETFGTKKDSIESGNQQKE